MFLSFFWGSSKSIYSLLPQLVYLPFYLWAAFNAVMALRTPSFIWLIMFIYA